MAFKGSLKEFNISNILQMIKMEDKTGTLHVKSEDDSIHISFVNGSVVYAYSEKRNDENRFKFSLILNRLIKKENWVTAKKEHDQTLRPYWEILKKYVNEQSLSKLMSLQVTDTVYQLLRWTDGSYEFLAEKKVPFDNKLIHPIDVDFLLMEGIRVVDEWSNLRQKMPPMDSFIRKTILEEQDLLLSDFHPMKKKEIEGKEMTQKAKFLLEKDILESRKIKLTENEKKVLVILYQDTPLETVFNSTLMGHFETGDAIVSLMNRNLVRAIKKKRVASKEESNTSSQLKKVAFAAGAFVLGFLLFMGFQNQVSQFPSQWKNRVGALDQINVYRVQTEMDKLSQSIQIYYSIKGILPVSLDELVQSGLVPERDTLDPWMRPYTYKIEKNRFVLSSQGPDQLKPEDDVHFRSSKTS